MGIGHDFSTVKRNMARLHQGTTNHSSTRRQTPSGLVVLNSANDALDSFLCWGIRSSGSSNLFTMLLFLVLNKGDDVVCQFLLLFGIGLGGLGFGCKLLLHFLSNSCTDVTTSLALLASLTLLNT